MEFISTAKGLGRGGLIVIVLEMLRQTIPQISSSRGILNPSLLGLIILVGLGLLVFLIHYPLLRAVHRVHKQAVVSGATMLIYGLLWLFSFTAGQNLGGLAGILLTLGGILALVGANSATYQMQNQLQPNTISNGVGIVSANYANLSVPMSAPATGSIGANNYGNGSSDSSKIYNAATNGERMRGSHFSQGGAPLPDFAAANRANAPLAAIASLINFNEAVTLAQTGRKLEAYKALKTLEAVNPTDVNLLLWVAFTAPNLGEAQRAVGAASKVAPNHPSVVQAVAWLNEEARKAALY